MRLGEQDRLYLIADSTSARWPLPQAVAEAVQAGVRLVQLREKHLPDEEYLSLAREIRRLTARYGARLLINARPTLGPAAGVGAARRPTPAANARLRIALEVGADGVHVPGDGSIAEARRALGAQALIGASTHSEEELRRAAAEGADFVTLSPVFPVTSKPGYGAVALGLPRFAALVHATSLPVFALGGVRVGCALACLDADAFGIAGATSILCADDIPQTVRAYVQVLGSVGSVRLHTYGRTRGRSLAPDCGSGSKILGG